MPNNLKSSLIWTFVMGIGDFLAIFENMSPLRFPKTDTSVKAAWYAVGDTLYEAMEKVK